MSYSVRPLVDDARLIAAELGLKLPLAKARNALSMCLFGSPYSAAMAAEKAEKIPTPTADPVRAGQAAKVYRCDASILLAAADAALERWEDEDVEEHGYREFPEEGSPEYAIALLNAVKKVVYGAEKNHKRNGGSWADWDSIDSVHDAFGDNTTLQFDDCVGEFTAMIDEAINTDGLSLPADLRAMEKECRAAIKDQSMMDTAWISEIETAYANPTRKPAKARQPHRFAINLLLAPNFDAIEHLVLAGKVQAPRVDMHQVDYERMAEFLGERFNFRGSKLRVPNDMLDQATLHMRAMGMAKGDPEGQDFLAAFVKLAEAGSEQVVDVRKAWSPLHRIRDRTFAPPPCAISMLMETHDWEDGAQVLMRMRLMVGITAGTPQGVLERDNATTEGRIGTDFLEYLEKTFGVPYKPFVTLTNPYFTKIPEWAKPGRMG